MSNKLDAGDITNLIIFGAIGFWIYSAVTGPETPEKRPITNAATAGEELRPLGPDARDPFVETVSLHRDAYLNAENDVQRGVVRKSRGESLCQTFSSRFFRNWPGRLTWVSTTSDGQTVDRIKVELSDFGDNDEVAIEDSNHYEPGTLMHETLLNDVSPGDPVVVSGEFRYDTDDDVSDCFYEESISLSGGMTDPEYRAKFSSIRPAGAPTE